MVISQYLLSATFDQLIDVFLDNLQSYRNIHSQGYEHVQLYSLQMLHV